ncbi:MAG TPA: DNA repair protein RecO [bacterium]|nr:DNA repair protein RecO [bacterium]
MRRIVRSEAVCLSVKDYHESSKLLMFFTLEYGKVSCLAKGARRLRSKFGAALDLFAQSRIIYYMRENRTLFTLSDAELVHSFSCSQLPTPDSLSRFLAAEQMTEFVLRVTQPNDPSPHLYRLLLSYLSTLESLPPYSSTPDSRLSTPCSALVCSFLLKAASFLGFRPELRRCLICQRPIESQRPAYFDPGRGGIVCPRCAGENPRGTRLDPAGLDAIAFLLYTPAAEIAHVFSSGPEPTTGDNRQERQGRQDSDPENLQSPPPVSSSANPQSTIYNLQSPLDLVLGFLGHHFDPLVLNSFRWHAGLERKV